MKWFSVKKYRAPSDGYYFIRTENGAFYSAEWRNGNNDEAADYSRGWMMDTLAEEYGSPSAIEIFGVTHFCIPDPVEIEE